MRGASNLLVRTSNTQSLNLRFETDSTKFDSADYVVLLVHNKVPGE